MCLTVYPVFVRIAWSSVVTRLFWFAFMLACLVPDVSMAVCARPEGGTAPGRFLISDRDAYDSRTGLTWRRCSVGMTWKGENCTGERALMSLRDAMKAAERAGPGWRVPTIRELYSIVDAACGTPPLDLTVFPDIRAKDGDENSYWTTSEVGAAGLVYYVDLATGDSDAHSRGFSLAVRLVRSGP
jgi:hypothetical protein